MEIQSRSTKGRPSVDCCWDRNDAGSVGSEKNKSHEPCGPFITGAVGHIPAGGRSNSGEAVGHREEAGGGNDDGDSEKDRGRTNSCAWMGPIPALMTRGRRRIEAATGSVGGGGMGRGGGGTLGGNTTSVAVTTVTTFNVDRGLFPRTRPVRPCQRMWRQLIDVCLGPLRGCR